MRASISTAKARASADTARGFERASAVAVAGAVVSEAAVAEAGAAVSGAAAAAMSEMVMSEAGCGKFVSEVGGVVVVSVLGFG